MTTGIGRLALTVLAVAVLTPSFGAQQGGGPPDGVGEDEGYGNNLSVPAVFAEGIGILGFQTGVDTGLRPRPDDVNPAVLEYFDPNEIYVTDGTTYYPQQTTSHWQAQWRDGTAGSAEPVIVNWGDNLTHQSWTTRSAIRVEAVLYQDDATQMTGYEMQYLLGEMSEELFGTTGQTALSTYRVVYTIAARLTLEKLMGRAGPVDTSVPATSEAVYEGFGVDGPGGFGAEINGAGSIIYGYNWQIRQWPIPDTQKLGWWRLTFSVDPQATYTIVDEESGTSQSFVVNRNVSFAALDPADTTDDLMYKPVLVNNTTSVLEIELIASRGGGGGRGGGGTNPNQTYTLTITPPADGNITTTGIDCGGSGTACVTTQLAGSYMQLNATPAPGYQFVSFTGDADCLDGAVVLNANTSCSAQFVVGGGAPPASGLSRLIVVQPTGGTIYGAGIACGDAGVACIVDLPTGAVMGLDAVPSAGSTFTGWSAACPGGVVSMTTNRICMPTFSGSGTTPPPQPPASGLVQLNIVRPTGGTIYAAGIVCGDAGAVCSVDMPAGTTLGLDAIPSGGYHFDGWSGQGCGPQVILNASLTCTPSFSQGSVPRPGASEK